MSDIEGTSVAVQQTTAFVGGGSLPEQSLPSFVVAISSESVPEEKLAERLRTGTPSVMGRVQDGKVLLDLRTVFPDQEEELVSALRRVLA